MNDLDYFLTLINRALVNVNQSYYHTTYTNVVAFRAALQHRLGMFNGEDFERNGERVFCYEFYHQLSMQIYRTRRRNAGFLAGTILQGEVEKMHIIQLIDALGLENMDGEYCPDFLMHSPGNAASHPYVIEVKCEHDISQRKVLNDLKKLNQFIIHYRYERGLFISINSDDDRLADILNNLAGEIETLEGRGQIKVINKRSQESNARTWQL
jgi:hypothetical protein